MLSTHLFPQVDIPPPRLQGGEGACPRTALINGETFGLRYDFVAFNWLDAKVGKGDGLRAAYANPSGALRDDKAACGGGLPNKKEVVVAEGVYLVHLPCDKSVGRQAVIRVDLQQVIAESGLYLVT